MGALLGRKALVCGGSEGIGLASAQALAALGAEVTLLARREAPLLAALTELPVGNGQNHQTITADVLALDRVLPVIADTGFDILINNSAGPAGGALLGASDDQLLDVFRQHVLGNQQLVRAIVPGMQSRQWGRIVNIISTSVKEPIAMLGVSNTIRGAVASWAKTLAGELAADGITVNNVLPGYTRTQRLEQILKERAAATGKSEESIATTMLATVPAARFAEAKEVAHAVAFLCQPQSGYITGINLPVDGGRTKSL
ncbi:SDR family oxidoreductase [Arenimonas sp.]|jgi:3-oxoacyl-[acyl-carrier protein] reductase|uniref:SDR family oxidoreductase n=1 Tax=Arenimonas sp. TaxID=1872635 RepID=UPI0037BF2A5D